VKLPKLSSKQDVRLGLALQGGGAYGAYAKGVLKALFNSEAFRQNKKLKINAVTGTSAGAVNGAITTYGLNSGGYDEAIRILDSFWSEIEGNGRAIKMLSLTDQFNFFTRNVAYPNLPFYLEKAMGMMPAGSIPKNLQDQVERHMPDWDKHMHSGPVKLFVNAVLEDEKSKERSHIVFKGKELTPASIAASGALEELGGHMIDGKKFYDGAYWRNPCTTDIRGEGITDLLIVTLQKKPDSGVKPEHQDEARKRHEKPGHKVLTEEIHNHIAYMQKQYPHINLHVISLEVDPAWDDTSRMNIDPRWLHDLEDMGKRDAEKWLADHADKLGKKSSYGPAAP